MRWTLAQRLNPTWWVAIGLHWARNRLLNPTNRFPPRTCTRLTFDISARQVCGRAFNTPHEQFTDFGPANWFSKSGPYLELFFYDLGCTLDFDSNGLHSCAAYVAPEQSLYREAHAFESVVLDIQFDPGRRLQVSRRTTVSALSDFLGMPDQSEVIAGRMMHVYLLGQTQIAAWTDTESDALLEISFSSDGE